ncbi:MAG: DNA gyrase subunit A [Rickettsiales bacterium]|nr:DNA gyrase subunit A [Rickettsiales bacterium]
MTSKDHSGEALQEIPEDKTTPVTIEEEMKSSYLDYAMSIIVSRALPDVRDGLKPVHRRILFAMWESLCYYNKPFKKSARIVGEVMGKYHPHGDGPIYDSLVRMAQEFSLRLPLIDGQGNFGSIDGDAPAAMRYTESRLAKVSHSLLDDIDKDTIDFRPNYDNSQKEPTVLPAKVPNVLVNGAGGIAVGMATNIPPHNLGEVIDACCLYIKDHDITVDDLIEVIKGPDFPTAGLILGHAGVVSAIKTGRGSIIMRGKADIENLSDKKHAIIIKELPYAVNKAHLVEKIADLVRNKKIEGISDLRDESDRNGIRVVIELRRDAIPDLVLNQLYSYTALQTSFGVNMLALKNGTPQIMNVLDVIKSFVDFREEVVLRRTKFLLTKAQNKAHVLIGLIVAVNNIDVVIDTIKKSSDVEEAKTNLMALELNCTPEIVSLIKLVGTDEKLNANNQFKFSDIQAKAILELRLQRLTAMEQSKISDNLKELAEQIKNYSHILNSRERLLQVIEQELLEIKEEFATPRKTEIIANEFEQNIEDLIKKEDVVITVTHKGYIKRVPLSTYKSQKRGGKGRNAMSMQDDDFTTKLFVANTHTPVLFFSDHGKVYKLKAYKLPVGSATSKGRALVNVLPLQVDEKITTIMPLPEDESKWQGMHLMFATISGNVRRNDLSDFQSIQSNGKIAIKLEENDSLVGVSLCSEDDHILLAAKSGKCIRFPVSAVRVFKSRTSDGVRGIKLASQDEVVSMSVLHGVVSDAIERDEYLKIPLKVRKKLSLCEQEDEVPSILKKTSVNLSSAKILSFAQAEQFILTITKNGYGKRTSAYEYRVTNRGGQGIINIVTSARNGKVVSSFPVSETDQIMLITNQGQLIRCGVDGIRVTGRNTQGVTCRSCKKGEAIVSVALISDEDEDEDKEQE